MKNLGSPTRFRFAGILAALACVEETAGALKRRKPAAFTTYAESQLTGLGDEFLSSGAIQLPPPAGDALFFPLPIAVQQSGKCCLVLAEDVQVVLSEPGEASSDEPVALMRRAAARAEERLRKSASVGRKLKDMTPTDTASLIKAVLISVNDYSRGLTPTLVDSKDDARYVLTCKEGGCVIASQNVRGALHALDSTMIQLFAHAGMANVQYIQVSDAPTYDVRGLMIDAGRRFVPKDVLLHQVIDGMALMKMNLLQLHLSDFCRFSVALPAYPELNQTGFKSGTYSMQDLREIVDYASDRGITVLPEVDLPGHANGLLVLEQRGLKFCKPDSMGQVRPEEAVKVFDDPDGNTRNVLLQIFKDIASVLPEGAWFHIGGDEASILGQCTSHNIAELETFLVDDVLRKQMGRTAVAWEGVRAESLGRDTIVTVWEKDAWRDVARRGHRVIAASLPHHYLDFPYKDHPIGNFWYDLADSGSSSSMLQENDPLAAKLLGGMSAMWTDQYCFEYQCGAASSIWGDPRAKGLYSREHDAAFGDSLAGMIWPRAAVSAAAMWRYNDSLTDDDITLLAAWSARLLRDVVGVRSCPAGCDCDEFNACGRPHLPDNTTSFLDASNMAPHV